MSPTPDPAISNLTYLYQQQRNPTKTLDNTLSRGRNNPRHELGRRDNYGERVTRIYPRPIAKSPPTAQRYSSTSPSSPPTYNAAASPLLSALGATKTPATQYTREWTKSLPIFGNQASPGTGGITIAGTPPPFHNSPGTRDTVYGMSPMSNTPPASGGKPLSHPNHPSSFGGRQPSSPYVPPADRDRRASMFSQSSPRAPFTTNPPLPHQPQRHYYNLPDFDLGLNVPPSDGIAAGEGGYYCAFDTLGMAGDGPAKTSENVLLIGYQGGITVFRVEKWRMDVVGRLEGLRGSVLGAKILPCTAREWKADKDSLLASRPLIALVIHGPVTDELRGAHSGSDSSAVDDASSESPSQSPSSGGNDSAGKVTSYQTTVEIYSLKEKRRVAVLYRSPLIPITCPVDSPMFERPAPVGDFVVDAKGKFVVVASGTSGEIFIFAPYLRGHEDYPETFRCIGKVWTSVLFRERGTPSSASSAADGSHEDAPPEKYGVPIFSLSNRWLSVAPPASTTLFPVNGIALTSPYHERPPGLAHHTVPTQPSPNCTVEAPETAGLIDRITREGTQVAIKGALWAADKGLQAFKSYMNKGTPVNGNTNGYGADAAQQQWFPPTHGHNQAQPRQEPTVISIYDLQRLMDAEETKSKSALHAVATIPASLGCSFLSFSPSGVMLMVVNAKGDFQDVWDLKRMNSRRARRTSSDQQLGPHVRQVARFTRMTVANVVDVAWSTPKNDKVAVITDKGTVHMFLMPASAFQWPPPRRSGKSGPPPKPADNDVASNGSAISSAMKALNVTTKPLFDVVRTRNSGNGSRFPTLSSLGMTPAAGAKSGKAVAAGVGKSINNIRHAGDNKLSHPVSPSGVKPGSVRWLTGKGRGSIAVVSGGGVYIYHVSMHHATGRGASANATSISKTKTVEFSLPTISDARFAPSVAAQLFPQPGPDNFLDVHGEWHPRALPARRGKMPVGVEGPSPLSLSEIESSTPYQPFHTDRRVAHCLFARESRTVTISHVHKAPVEVPAEAPVEAPVEAPDSEALPIEGPYSTVGRKKKKKNIRLLRPPSEEIVTEETVQEDPVTEEPVSKDPVTKETVTEETITTNEIITNLHHKPDDNDGNKDNNDTDEHDPRKWTFGGEIAVTRLSSPAVGYDEFGDGDEGFGGIAARTESKMVMQDGEEYEEIVYTSRPRRGRAEADEEGFFLEDCEVYDFAGERV